MADGDDDWFSPGLESVSAQQPIWPVPQGWQQPQAPAQPQQPSGFWFGNPPDWLNRLGSSLSNLAGGNPQDYLGAVSLAKVGKPDPWGGQAFHIMDERGGKVGEIEAHMAEPDLLKIDWEGGGKNTLNFSNSRSVLPELMREFPDMKRFTAYRISGARHGPAAQYKGRPGEATDIPYMTPIIKVPAHIKANPPNQWSGKWLHEDSGRWMDDAEGEPQRRRIFPRGSDLPAETARANQLLESLRGQHLMQQSEHEEIPPALSQRVLDAARARERGSPETLGTGQPAAPAPQRESVNTPEELRNLDRNIQAFRERQQMFNRPPPAPARSPFISDEEAQNVLTSMGYPPTPPAPQPAVTSPRFNPTRYGIPTAQQTPGPFTAQSGTGVMPYGSYPMGTFQSQPMNLQMLSEQLNRERMGYGGAGSQRMEEE